MRRLRSGRAGVLDAGESIGAGFRMLEGGESTARLALIPLRPHPLAHATRGAAHEEIAPHEEGADGT
jgi:hypothetical protein